MGEGVTLKTGSFVTVIAKDPKNSYYNGEYYILAVGPASKSIIGVKPVVGYGAHEKRTISLAEYDVVEQYSDPAFLKRWAIDLFYYSEAPKRGEKLQWVEYVYSENAVIARAVMRQLESEQPKAVTECKINALRNALADLGIVL